MEKTTIIANRYQLQNKLGEGGMGAVYQTYDRLTQDTIALKRVLTPITQLEYQSKDASSNEQAALVREFRTLASMRHPNIISVLDYGFDDNQQPFFTMSLLENATNLLEAGQHKSEREKVQLLVQTLQALIYLHRRNILHRDLKPANVLVTEDDVVKVLDFGLSTTVQEAQGFAGTFAYIAPEVIQKKPATPSTDLYAIGLIAYEMLIGHSPFQGRTPTQLIQQILRQQPDVTTIENTDLGLVLSRLLLKNPTNRYQSAQDVIIALCEAVNIDPPQESSMIRESFLQASEFVGRDNELKMLKDDLALVLQGSNSFYLVGGESGVGKSRLLDELRIQALVSGATVLRGQAVENGVLFQLWRNIIRRCLLMVDDISDLQASILLDIVPDIGDLLGRHIEKAPELTDKTYQDRIVLTIVDLVRRINRPLVILLEDLQWADESLDILKQFLRVQDQFKQLMIVGNYRNDEAPALADELETMTIIDLERFNETALQTLSVSMLGQAGAQSQVIDLLQKETEGNIFFLVETVRALAEEAGSLDRVGKVTLPERVFTGQMQQLMQRRLNKVDEQYHRIQTLAAIIGREIDLELLTHLYDRSQVEDWLINASEHAIVDVQDNQWRFSHDKLRESLIAHIHDDERANIHRDAAQSIETIYADNDTYAPQLIHLWRHAQNAQKELHYIMIEGKKLNELAGLQNFKKAEQFFERAFIILPDAKPSKTVEVNLITYFGMVHVGLHQLDKAISWLEKAVISAREIDDKVNGAHALVGLARASIESQDKEQTLAWLDQGVQLAKLTDDSHVIASALSVQGYLYAHYNEMPKALDSFFKAYTTLKDANLEADSAILLNNIGKLKQTLGEYESAKTYLTEARNIALQTGQFNTAVLSTSNLGIASYFCEEYAEAVQYYQQSLQMMRETGDIVALSHLWILKAFAEMETNDIKATQLSIFNAIKDRQDTLRQYSNIYILMGAALVARNNDDIENGINWWALAEKLGGADPFIREWLDPLKAKYATQYSQDEMQAVLETVDNLDLDTVMLELESKFSQQSE